jgi:hypothetical protein
MSTNLELEHGLLLLGFLLGFLSLQSQSNRLESTRVCRQTHMFVEYNVSRYDLMESLGDPWYLQINLYRSGLLH